MKVGRQTRWAQPRLTGVHGAQVTHTECVCVCGSEGINMFANMFHQCPILQPFPAATLHNRCVYAGLAPSGGGQPPPGLLIDQPTSSFLWSPQAGELTCWRSQLPTISACLACFNLSDPGGSHS